MQSRSLAFAALVSVALGSMAPRAEAFCGFYVSGSSEQLGNKATRVALMRYGQRTVLTMSNDYEGPPQDFAMVIPVPIVLQQENVRTLPHDVFERIETLTAPRLVEYWEQNPCPTEREYYVDELRASPGVAVSRTTSESDSAPPVDLGVRIETRFSVGEYEVLVLSATQSSGLETWLRQNRYNIPNGAATVLAPYIREGMKFFVARVDIERARAKPGGRRLSPLRFHYDTPEFRLPVRLGLLNARDKQDLIVYVLHPNSRVEVANIPNVFIPTNLDVDDSVRTRFGAFYNALFDLTMNRMNGRAVVTEYAWASTSSCDPCPGPNVTLTPDDMMTLGVDVIDPSRSTFDRDGRFGRVQGGAISRFAYGMTVTRLHTRYDATTLSEDLVFREAGAVFGGREIVTDPRTRQLEQGAQPSPYGNNFQGRYAIRHLWEGPITCANPRRYVWGGPPSSHRGSPATPSAATDLASQPRTGADPRTLVRTDVPELGIRAARPVAPSVTRSSTKSTFVRASAAALSSACVLGATVALGRRRKRTPH
ncbi:MAG: DUF2330 domain-containing protein [Myxococcales bacterium]|nr:DUF2330 domain-containing protein [Myxococcales bacterium]